ncbi:MAG TPA: hypothetical protein VEL49_07075 [Ktedonobacteraceae bacterium]|nr:hypothetical protein [Ktedonobacteraceae bacterium]
MEDKFPWYRIAEAHEELEQGDFIDECPVLLPTYSPIEIEDNTSDKQAGFHVKGVEEIRDLVIVSQSCVLENGKIDFVHLCPRLSYSQFVAIARNLGHTDSTIFSNLNAIRLGRVNRYCMLEQCRLTNFSREIQIVDFGIDYFIPFEVMKRMAQSTREKVRLLSPYKEHLAQAFGYFHMRVALPNPIAEFVKPKVPMQAGLKLPR